MLCKGIEPIRGHEILLLFILPRACKLVLGVQRTPASAGSEQNIPHCYSWLEIVPTVASSRSPDDEPLTVRPAGLERMRGFTVW